MRRSAIRPYSAWLGAGLLVALVSSAAASSAAGGERPGFGPVAASFISPARGWVLGTRGCTDCAAVRTTTDGGRTWTALPSPRAKIPIDPPGSRPVEDIAFADSRNGFLFGTALLVTHDGGKSWRRDAELPPVQALGIGAGYVLALTELGAGRVRLWRARVGHDRWSEMSLPKDAARPAYEYPVQLSVEGSEIVLLGTGDTILASSDAGVRWVARTLRCPEGNGGGSTTITIARGHPRSWLVDCFSSMQSSQAMHTQHVLFRTVNAGISWTRLHRPIQSNDPDLLADNGAGHLFLATDGNADVLVGSLDTGRRWNRVVADRGSFGGWKDLRFVTPTVGFVVGPRFNGHLYRTDDAGRTWRIVSTT